MYVICHTRMAHSGHNIRRTPPASPSFPCETLPCGVASLPSPSSPFEAFPCGVASRPSPSCPCAALPCGVACLRSPSSPTAALAFGVASRGGICKARRAQSSLVAVALLMLSLAGCSALLEGPMCRHYQAMMPEGLAATGASSMYYTERGMLSGMYLKDGKQYEWMTTQQERLFAQTITGSPTRLRAALHRFQTCPDRHPLTISFLGGRATHPSPAASKTGLSYPRWVELILRKVLLPEHHPSQSQLRFFSSNGPLGLGVQPHQSQSTSIRGHNNSQQTLSGLHVIPTSPHLCHRATIPPTSDIIFLEHNTAPSSIKECGKDFAYSDLPTFKLSFEDLLRQLMQLPNSPAVIIVNTLNFNFSKADLNFVDFELSCEADMSEFATFYQLPMLSLKAVAFQKMRSGETGYQIHRPIYNDSSFQAAPANADKLAEDQQNLLFADPRGSLNGATGSRVLAELAAQLVLDAAAGLLAAPFQADVERPKLVSPLPHGGILPPSPFTLTCPSHNIYNGSKGPDDGTCLEAAAPSPPWLLQGPTELSIECVSHSYNMKPAWQSKASRGVHPSMSPFQQPGFRMYRRDEFLDGSYLQEERYTWFTPDDDLLAGLTYPGQQSRLRGALDRYLNHGANLTVTFLGGSVTAGSGRGEDGLSYVEWMELVWRKILGKAPSGNLRVVNAGIHATTSALMALCHALYAPADTDIFFVEYSWNDAVAGPGQPADPMRRSYERLIRKLLNYPNRPAVVLLHYTKDVSQAPETVEDKDLFERVMHDMILNGSSDEWEEFTVKKWGGYAVANAERDLMEQSWYYQLPSVSTKAALYHLQHRQLDGFTTYRPVELGGNPWIKGFEKESHDYGLVGHAFFMDCLGHPGGQSGHRAVGELCAQVLLDAAASLAAAPLNQLDHTVIQAPLPAPMLRDNFESKSDSCHYNASLLEIADKGPTAWQWTDEGRGKWGWVATEPGAKLILRFSSMGGTPTGVESETTDHAKAPSAPPNVSVHIAFLSSYDHMGSSLLECVSGCECSPKVVDAHQDLRMSQLLVADLNVTQHPSCVMSATVRHETSCPCKEHKFKIGGLIVAEEDLQSNQGSVFMGCIPGSHKCYGANGNIGADD